MSLEENIKNEIRLWSKEALEKPNENYNNMPACPFAKRAWADDRVVLYLKKMSLLMFCLKQFMGGTIEKM